jgi:hypothetical protein
LFHYIDMWTSQVCCCAIEAHQKACPDRVTRLRDCLRWAMDYVLTRLYLYIFEDQRSLLLI